MRVTEASDDVILTLDGRPALDQLRQQLPPEIARDLQLAAGIIHIGLPVPGTDRPDYLVRPLRAIDPTRGWLAVGGGVAVGDRLMFVQQDNASARLDMQRMLADIARRVGNRSIKGGIFISSAARGEAMFGSDHAEAGMITRSLGDFPLIGLISQGEFCHDRLYGVTAVLALVLG
jgi:small ligand-binding sensory domain FIST